MIVDIETFINLIREEPPLWDKTSASYKDSRVREECWYRVGIHMFYGFCHSKEDIIIKRVQEMKRKWRYLRRNFLRSINEPNKYKEYEYAHLLTFLVDEVKTKPSYDNNGTNQHKDNEESSVLEDEESYIDTDSDVESEPSTPSHNQQSTPSHNQESTPSYNQQNSPSYNQQNSPAYNQQSTPSYNKPITPSYNRPSTPSYNQQGTPSYNQPSTPSHNQQSTPSHNKKSTPSQNQQSTPSHNQKSTPSHNQHSDTGTSSRRSSNKICRNESELQKIIVSGKHIGDTDDSDRLFLLSLLSEMERLNNDEKLQFKIAALQNIQDIRRKRKRTYDEMSQ